jgi:hypothetical protein
VGITLLLFGIMALTFDVGFWFVERRTGQNRADAAVLAAVQELPAANVANATSVAQHWLEQNGEDESECDANNSSEYDLFDGGFAYDDSDADGLYDRIRACVAKDGVLVFSKILGLTGVNVRAVAAAGVLEEPARYALMAMNPDSCDPGDGEKSLYLHGNPEVILGNEGSSYTASPCLTEGLYLQGDNADMTGGLHDFCGDDFYETSDNLVGTPRPAICNIPDPWASYAQPVPGTCKPHNGSGNVYDDLVQTPGTFCRTLDIRDHVTFQPGVYIFKAGMQMQNNNYSITGNGVVFYFTCSDAVTVCCPPSEPDCTQNADEAAPFEMNGGTINVSAPDSDPHIVIWIDRTSRAPSPANKCHVYLIGNGGMSIAGHVYSLNGCVSIGGTSDGSNRSFDGTILGDKIEFSGNATYNINWDEDFAPKIFIPTLIE